MRKLVLPSYANAHIDITEALAVDHFIDALSETEMRLRLREVGPKTLSKVARIVVRIETHRIAD